MVKKLLTLTTFIGFLFSMNFFMSVKVRVIAKGIFTSVACKGPLFRMNFLVFNNI